MKVNCKYNSSSFYFIFLSLILLLYRHKSEENNLSSSVYCQNSKFGNKMCSFKNLCYTKEAGFVFLLSESSVLSGIESINDLKLIKTSSVSNNSAFYLKLTTVKDHSFTYTKENVIFAIQRFKPDNLLHVIHDDLLPLHNSYSKLCFGDISDCRRRFQLLFLDENDPGPFFDFYKVYSQNPLFLSNLNNLCFSKIYFYLDEETVFYQYGYKTPHGPVDSNLSPTLLFNFKNYVLKHFNIEEKKSENVYTILRRKSNRKIINVDYIERLIKNVSLNCRIIKIDVMENSIYEILMAVSMSKLFIGMHGGGMILSIFLPPESSVIEMFPFGIQKHVSPLFSLSKYKVHFIYSSWTNLNKSNSISHPEYGKHLGGIGHLSVSHQEIIKKTDLVPPVLCCDDPLYLFRMYQDTIVDDSLLTVLQNTLNSSKKWNVENEWFFPGLVRNFSLRVIDSVLDISWVAPFNALKDPLYSVTLVTSVKNLSFVTNKLFSKIDFKTRIDYCRGWISCIFEKVQGSDTFSMCSV